MQLWNKRINALYLVSSWTIISCRWFFGKAAEVVCLLLLYHIISFITWNQMEDYITEAFVWTQSKMKRIYHPGLMFGIMVFCRCEWFWAWLTIWNREDTFIAVCKIELDKHIHTACRSWMNGFAIYFITGNIVVFGKVDILELRGVQIIRNCSELVRIVGICKFRVVTYWNILY